MVRVKRIQAPIIAGLLLLMLILPQSALAAGPEILNVSVTDITETTAEISWTTNTTSDSRVNYGTTTGLGQTKPGASEGTAHNIILTGLTQGTKYYFEVESTDTSGPNTDDNEGEYYSFTTLAPATYTITLAPVCGVCGELIEAGLCDEIIEVTATVAAAGTYHICWDSRAAGSVVGTFTVSGAGIRTLTFFMPEAKKGSHNVYLVDNTYADPATNTFATFTVNPSVKIDLEEGPVGTEVTLNGYGFAASQDIRVTLFQGEVKKGEEKTATANTVGSWEVFYTIPDTPAGGYIFKVEGKEGTVWVNWVSKYFKVIPEITVTPDSGTVGQKINIEGTGFASEEEDIEVTFDGEARKENITADEDGSWSASITVPIRTCGRYDIAASGETTRARNVDPVKFTVIAGISVTPALAYVGDEITVIGGGFAPGEEGVKVTFDGTVVATDIPVDTYGCWESSFALRLSAYGSHTVSASGDTTAAVTTTLDTQAQMIELSPAEGAPGDVVSLTGNGFRGSQDLTVTIGGVAASGDMRTQSNGNVNISFRVPKGSPEGEQTLVVTDEGGATDSTDFTVMKKTLSTTPLPISPKDNRLRSGDVTFNWQGATGSTTYTYTLEINTTAGSGNIWSKSGIAESSYTLTEDEALPKGTYYWRVKVVDDYGNEGAWSDYIEFRVSPIPTWVWVVVGLVVLVVLMVVAYRETKFKVTE
ncbi:MAG: hypothetical protein E3I25_01650 [Dehalococcoidia bacterium]|nr:MAG: hypothetical protein E3I25_01650 [Dehalococcoidia bacterium]